MIENLETRRFLSASVANGILTVTGTEQADRINVVQRGAAVIVHEGKAVTRFGKRDHIQQIVVNALGGNDRITIVSKTAATVDAGDGNDLIIGSDGADVLLGGNGNDRILGQRGNDSITGGAGRDVLFGGSGDDTIEALDTEADQVTGGRGNDSARVDSGTDTGWNIENYLTTASGSSPGAVTIENGSYVYTGQLNVSGTPNGTGTVVFGSVPIVEGSFVLNVANASGATSPVDGLFEPGFHPAGTLTFYNPDGTILRQERIGEPDLGGSVTISDFIDLASNSNGAGTGTWQESDSGADANVTIPDFIDLASFNG